MTSFLYHGLAELPAGDSNLGMQGLLKAAKAARQFDPGNVLCNTTLTSVLLLSHDKSRRDEL